MTAARDYSGSELTWLAMIERHDDIFPPQAVKTRLVQTGVADDDPTGLKITGIGSQVLDQARDLNLLPKA